MYFVEEKKCWEKKNSATSIKVSSGLQKSKKSWQM